MNKLEVRKYNKEYYEKNKLYFKKYNKKYRESIDGKLSTQKSIKKYLFSHKGKLAMQKANKKYNKNNSEKVKSRRFINNLIHNSDFTRDNCCICGKPNSEFHHENYDLPNFGYWLCNEHHNEIHRGVIL